MPATSLAAVKNIAEACERALAEIHKTVGGQQILPRADQDLDDLWIVCNFNLGPSTGHKHKRPDGVWDFDIFQDCLIEWEINAPRIPGEKLTREVFVSTYTLLAQEATRIALAMDPARWSALNALLPLHKLNDLVPAGRSQGFNADSGCDMATVRFRCICGIRPDAWPTDLSAYANPTL